MIVLIQRNGRCAGGTESHKPHAVFRVSRACLNVLPLFSSL
jgi:hypothetical protein